MFKRNSRNANNIIFYTRNISSSRETSNSKPSGTKKTPATARMPATVQMQATEVTQATTVMSATSNIKNESNFMTAHNSRNESNNRTANTVWTPSKAGMLAKTVNQQHGGRPTAAERIGTSQCQQQKGDPQQQGCQNSLDSQQLYLHQQGRQQHKKDANKS
jgi:hypothetical protein